MLESVENFAVYVPFGSFALTPDDAALAAVEAVVDVTADADVVDVDDEDTLDAELADALDDVLDVLDELAAPEEQPKHATLNTSAAVHATIANIFFIDPPLFRYLPEVPP